MFRSLQAMEFMRTIDLGDNLLLMLHCILLCLHNSVWIAFGFHACLWTFPHCLLNVTFSPSFRIFVTNTKKHNSLSSQGLTHERTARPQKCWLPMNLIALYQLIGNFNGRESENHLPMSAEFFSFFSDDFCDRKGTLDFRLWTSDFGLRTSDPISLSQSKLSAASLAQPNHPSKYTSRDSKKPVWRSRYLISYIVWKWDCRFVWSEVISQFLLTSSSEKYNIWHPRYI